MTPLAVATGLPIVIDPRVRERMEYSPDVWGSVESFLDDWQEATLDRDHQPLSGDSARAASARLVDAVRDHAVVGGLVVIATHGGVTTDMLRALCGDRDIDPSLIRDGMPNGHVTTLSVRGDAIDVVDVGVDPRVWTGRRSA
jgi:broad specificity phosphatase PhoE